VTHWWHRAQLDERHGPGEGGSDPWWPAKARASARGSSRAETEGVAPPFGRTQGPVHGTAQFAAAAIERLQSTLPLSCRLRECLCIGSRTFGLIARPFNRARPIATAPATVFRSWWRISSPPAGCRSGHSESASDG
jgi:hypothetical protein